MDEDKVIHCSFCGTGSNETRIMIVTNLPDGQQVAICGDCVTTCSEIVEDLLKQDERISHMVVEARMDTTDIHSAEIDKEIGKEAERVRRVLGLSPDEPVSYEEQEKALRFVLNIDEDKEITPYDRKRWRYMVATKEELNEMLETADEEEKDLIKQCLLNRFQS